MSYYCYTFNVKNLNDIKEYLLILKNCLRIMSRKKLYDGFINKRLHVGFCKEINKFYYTKNFSKNKTYITEKDVFFGNINYLKVFKELKLNKHLNRKIEFEVKDNILYPISLYSLEAYNIIIAFSDLFVYFNSDNISNIKDLNLQIKIENYQHLYNKFFDLLKNKIAFKETKILSLIDLKKTSSNSKTNYKFFEQIMLKNQKPLKTQLFYYTTFIISIEFNKFLNEEFGFLNKDFYIFDRNVGKIIKIPNSFYTKIAELEEKKDLLSPLMPVSF